MTLAIGKVGWMIIREITSPPVALLNSGELLDAFGALLLVLVGIEPRSASRRGRPRVAVS